MTTEIIIFAYWLLFAAAIGRVIYIRKKIIIPTLKEYGADYQEYFSPAKQKEQLEEYKKICESNRLTDKYWRYISLSSKLHFVLFIGWIAVVVIFGK